MIPGYKEKGEGGPEVMKHYSICGLSSTFGRLLRRALASRLMRFLRRFLANTFFGCILGASTNDPLVLLCIILDASRWLAEYRIRVLPIDLAGAFEGPFRDFPLRAQNHKFFLEGLRGMTNAEAFEQEEGEGTGAPESPALFLMVLAWFLVGVQRFAKSAPP